MDDLQKAVHIGCLGLWLRSVLALSDKPKTAMDAPHDAGVCKTCRERFRHVDVLTSESSVWLRISSQRSPGLAQKVKENDVPLEGEVFPGW